MQNLMKNCEDDEMGRVKKETTNDGRNNHEWDAVNLSNINNLYILIKNRSQFEESYLSKQFSERNPLLTQGIPKFVENIICIYADIDRYIKITELTEMQEFILKYIMLGYGYRDISEFIKSKYENEYTPSDVKEFFVSICRRIFLKIKNDYEIWLEISEHKKISPTSKFEVCCMCKEYHDFKNLIIVNTFNNKKYYLCKLCKSFTNWKGNMKKKYKTNKVY